MNSASGTKKILCYIMEIHYYQGYPLKINNKAFLKKSAASSGRQSCCVKPWEKYRKATWRKK